MISCVMSTRDRRRLVGQAIWYFLRQDYEARELVVIDDGREPVGDLVPDDPRIRYVRLREPAPAAASRAAARRAATGEAIAHWDDGTWYGPHRLSAQMSRLNAGAGATALTGLLHYQPRSGRAWCQTSRIEPSTLLHWRDTDPQTDALDAQDGSEHAVAVLHGSRTGAVNTADPSWRPRPFEDVRRLLDLDLGFYTSGHGAPARTRRRRTQPVPVTLAATFMVYDGYGSMAEYLALGMARAGAEVQVLPLRMDAAGISDELCRMIDQARPDPSGIVLCHAWWGENLARFGAATDLFVKTAWESSRLPADWPARLNETRGVIVPSRWAARVFRESGVTVPVEVAHEGVDPAVYPYVERPERRGPTTLVVGVLAERKNFRQAIAAWQLAFADNPDARLILKARFQLEPLVPDDARIRVVDTNEPTRGILHWYREGDILLALGNEGFGLSLVEGMATGLPAVALDSEAQADVCREARGALLPVPPARWAKVDEPPFGPCGVRAIPDVEAAARSLRWVADHPTEAREMGRRASAWAHSRRNVWNLGPQTLEAIERRARTSRPLRRVNALWAPLTGSPGGYRLYTEGLRRHLRQTRLHEAPPRAWRAKTLHVQHLPRLFDDAALVRTLHECRRQGAAVVVTEHAVGQRAEAWEGPADALVALDQAAAARLRSRWPGKRVEVIPPGGPDWCEPSRDGRDGALALIGAPDEALAHELASLPVRLIAVGAHAARALKADATYAMPASGGVLARRLSREADAVLVLCEAQHLARTALAAGVPVVVPEAPVALAGAVLQAADLAQAVKEVLASDALRRELIDRGRDVCESSTWPRVAALHHALWHALES